MLTLPPCKVHHPTTTAEAVAIQKETGGRYIAGGTDVLVNLKHHINPCSDLISLESVSGLCEITAVDGLRIGASTSLYELETSPLVRAHQPALSHAAGLIAGPQHRRMGTLGGNVMLDTRCLFYNQSESWRDALGGCLKADGTWCHVIGSGKACVAAQSSDTVPVLIAADAVAHAMTSTGPIAVPLRELYGTDGRLDRLHKLPPGALLTHIQLRPARPGERSAYRKVRSRGAIDFPQLSVAVVLCIEQGVLSHLDVVLGALLPQPRHVRNLGAFIGRPLDAATIDAVAHRALKQARPQPQVHSSDTWRRDMVRVEVQRALSSLITS